MYKRQELGYIVSDTVLILGGGGGGKGLGKDSKLLSTCLGGSEAALAGGGLAGGGPAGGRSSGVGLLSDAGGGPGGDGPGGFFESSEEEEEEEEEFIEVDIFLELLEEVNEFMLTESSSCGNSWSNGLLNIPGSYLGVNSG